MGKHFMSVLGVGPKDDYKIANYKLDLNSKQGCETKYIQEALISFKFDSPLKADDKITIFTTEVSEQKQWAPNDKEGLKAILEKKYPEKAPFKSVNIPSGKNNDELMQIFKIFYDSIEEGDKIIFDITHSFRSIPMFVLTVLCYARVLKNITVEGIYYGAFEAAATDQDSLKPVPIFDMTMYMNIIDWSFAAQLMTDYGNAEMMCKLYEEQKNLVNDDMKKQLAIFENPVKRLEEFTKCIQTSRGKINDKSKKENSISKSYERFLSSYEEASHNNSPLIEPLAPLFEKVVESTKEFNTKSNLEIGLATIKWCIDKGFTQQGLTALDETIKTYVCVKFDLDETNKTYREKIAKYALNLKAKDYNTSDIPSLIRDNYKNNEKDLNKCNIDIDNYCHSVQRLVVNIENKVSDVSKDITDYRNDINHFGFSAQPYTYNILQKKLKDGYEEIFEIIQNDTTLSK